MKSARSRCFLSLLFASSIVAPGCNAVPGGPARPVPVETARAALVATLDAWKSGRRGTSEFLGSKPAVGVVDTLRRTRPLVDYEVVGPLAATDAVRPFAVRLVLAEPAETLTTRYLVTGEDPLWVFRQEDYELILHWEHKMTDEPIPAPPPPSRSD